MAFRLTSLLPLEAQERLARNDAEALRLYHLGDAWLARELLALAREAQKATPQHRPEAPTYNSVLIYGIIPEIARRLGVVKLALSELNWEVRPKSDYELRVHAGHCLKNIGYSTLPGWNMLTRDVCHGNPVLYAVDRLCPGAAGDKEDPSCRLLAEVAAARKKSFSGVWTPEF